jgi:hypothetical protein
MWFGQFVHGVLEEAFRRYATAREAGQNDSPPWSATRLEEIRDMLVFSGAAAQALLRGRSRAGLEDPRICDWARALARH